MTQVPIDEAVQQELWRLRIAQMRREGLFAVHKIAIQAYADVFGVSYHAAEMVWYADNAIYRPEHFVRLDVLGGA